MAASVMKTEVHDDDKLIRWHHRLGHTSFTTMLHIPILRSHWSNSCIKDCSICTLAKQSCLSFPSSSSHARHPFELLHLDLWGSYKTSTIDGYRFFLTVVDDYSRYTWIFLMKCKSDTPLHVKNFLQMVRTQFGCSLKIVRSDNGVNF